MKVRTNAKYRFNPCIWDSCIPTSGLTAKKGDIVKVINLSNAPKTNTVGQCYIANERGDFAGMVSTNSLDRL